MFLWFNKVCNDFKGLIKKIKKVALKLLAIKMLHQIMSRTHPFKIVGTPVVETIVEVS